MSNGEKTDEAWNVADTFNGLLASKEPKFDWNPTYNLFYMQNGHIRGYTYSWLVSNSNFQGADRKFVPVVALGSGLKLEATGTGTAGSQTNPWIISKVN